MLVRIVQKLLGNFFSGVDQANFKGNISLAINIANGITSHFEVLVTGVLLKLIEVSVNKVHRIEGTGVGIVLVDDGVGGHNIGNCFIKNQIF